MQPALRTSTSCSRGKLTVHQKACLCQYSTPFFMLSCRESRRLRTPHVRIAMPLPFVSPFANAVNDDSDSSVNVSRQQKERHTVSRSGGQ
eukprot:6948-Heterococcus_DN1.PRE.6